MSSVMDPQKWVLPGSQIFPCAFWRGDYWETCWAIKNPRTFVVEPLNQFTECQASDDAPFSVGTFAEIEWPFTFEEANAEDFRKIGWEVIE